MRYPALAIANYFIDKANLSGEVLDHLKIQKLVYIAHGWHLAIFDDPLIDEPVQAWKYGPVIPSLYQAFKRHGNAAVVENEAVVRRNGEISVPSVSYDDDQAQKLLGKVWKAYSKYTGVQLSNLTHQTGTPWDQTWKEARGRNNKRINDQLIARHFRELVRHD